MQPSPTRDLILGAFVAAGLATLGYLSIQIGGVHYAGDGGLTLYATFDEIGGLKPRAPVAIAGVRVGQVTSIELDDLLRARVTLDLDKGLQLPIDSSAGIRTQGLLGDQLIGVDPGGEEDLLVSGDTFEYTESALSIERLIGRFVQDSGVKTE